MKREPTLIIMLLVGFALVVITLHLYDALERTALCQAIPSLDTCCPPGGCKFKPASEETRPYRP